MTKKINKRTFHIIQTILSIIYIPVTILIFTISLLPGLLISIFLHTYFILDNIFFQSFFYAFSISFTYIIFGLTQLFLISLIYIVFPFKIKEGTYHFRSTMCLKWAFNSSLLKLVKFTFLDFVTPSFINILFFKMLGANIGKNVQINTIRISDPWLLSIDDNSMIGGSANINGHSFENNTMIFQKVKIGKNATIGASSIVWQNTSIGDNSTLASMSLLLKGSVIPDNQIWAGIPSKFLKEKNINN